MWQGHTFMATCVFPLAPTTQPCKIPFACLWHAIRSPTAWLAVIYVACNATPTSLSTPTPTHVRQSPSIRLLCLQSRKSLCPSLSWLPLCLLSSWASSLGFSTRKCSLLSSYTPLLALHSVGHWYCGLCSSMWEASTTTKLTQF